MRELRIVVMVTLLLTTLACTRRRLCDCDNESLGESALLDVKVDWSISGITPLVDNRSDDDYVHRLSLRFFPKDGSAPFDRYLESNLFEGQIEVPVGDYSIVAFNESIVDPYWQGVVEFEDVDDYQNFAARIADESDRSQWDYFEFDDELDMGVEPYKLASWSLDDFYVSEAMCSVTTTLSDDEQAQKEALLAIILRPLTTTTTIYAQIENLASVYTLHASLEGLAERVNMRSGDTYSTTTTHIWQLTKRDWDDEDEQLHGTICGERLTFTTPSEAATHTLTLEVLFVDGSRYEPDEALEYDVSDQIRGLTRYADDELEATVSASLPYVSGDIEVESWSDDEEIELK